MKFITQTPHCVASAQVKQSSKIGYLLVTKKDAGH